MALTKRIRRTSELAIVAEEAAKFGLSIPKSIPKAERYISPNEAAKILNITGEAVKQWIYNRHLPSVKLSNGYWKVKVADLENFIKTRNNISQRRILIVDHANETAQEVVQEVIKMGHESVVAQNTADAMLKAVDLVPNL